jgi:hypothetical protein
VHQARLAAEQAKAEDRRIRFAEEERKRLKREEARQAEAAAAEEQRLRDLEAAIAQAKWGEKNKELLLQQAA